MNIIHFIVEFFGIIILAGIIVFVLVHILMIMMIGIDELRRKHEKN